MKDINIKLNIDRQKFKDKLGVKDGHTPTEEELTELIKPLIPEPIRGGRGDKGTKGDPGKSIVGPRGPKGESIIGPQGLAGLDGKDGSSDTPEQIIEKLNPLKNKLNFEILKNIPDFVLFKDLPKSGQGGGGGGSIITFRDSTGARISAYVTDIQYGSGLATSYSSGKITLTSTGLGGTVTSVGSADGSITVTNPTTTPDLSVVQAPKLTTGRTISITGDITYTSGSFDGSANVTGTGTLASVIVAGGPTGSATVAPIITYDAKGRLTAVSNATITPAVGSITGLGTGVATALAVNVGSAGAFLTFNGAGGTPSSLTGTNISGTAASLTAGNVTTNANLTGPITSVGNATSIASQTGTGTKFVVDTSPTITTPTFFANTNKTMTLSENTSSSISDWSSGSGAFGFSRPNDGVNNLDAIFAYNTAGGKTNLALAVRDDLVFAAGAGGLYTVQPDIMRLVGASGNLKLAGTANRATTEGTNHLDIFDGTAPVGTLASGISLYSTSGELRVMDAAGNSTLLSPHSKIDNAWIFHSKESTTGRVLHIDVEKLLKKLNDKFGWDFIQEYIEPI